MQKEFTACGFHESVAKEAKAGQFISLFSKDGSRLLPRPISLCEIDREGGRLRIVYRVAGAGIGGVFASESGG